jgi:hypothetical protein
MIIYSAQLREDPFFEVAGLPGRLFLESFYFGDPDGPANYAWSNIREISPITFYPDRKRQGSSSLLRNLDNLRADTIINPVVEAIGICSIGAAFKGDKDIETTIYMFFECYLSKLFGSELKNEGFLKIEFGYCQRLGTFVTKNSW